jgi:hypothetical protein
MQEQADCWINAGWSAGLTVSGHPESRDPGGDGQAGGLVTALVARRRRHRHGVTVCPDFEPAREHLGPWSGPSPITFGCNAKPTYVQGPHDDTAGPSTWKERISPRIRRGQRAWAAGTRRAKRMSTGSVKRKRCPAACSSTGGPLAARRKRALRVQAARRRERSR